MRHQQDGLAFRLSRAAESRVPLDVLWFVLFPVMAVRSLRELLRARGDLPASRLPRLPGDPRPSFAARFRFHLGANTKRLVLSWGDRLAEPRWAQRIDVVGAHHLDAVLGRPVIAVTLHARSTLILNLWLRTRRVPVGVVVDPGWLDDPTAQRRAQERPGLAALTVLTLGATRDMVRFVQPGQILMAAIDFSQGRMVAGAWSGGVLRTATGIFRLAEMTNATVLPIVGVETGRWRWRFVIAEPVPASFITERRFEDAATWVAQRIVPEIARVPEQALRPLVDNLVPEGTPVTGAAADGRRAAPVPEDAPALPAAGPAQP